jgi:hypothetical protein
MVKPPLLCSPYTFVLRPNWQLMEQAYGDYKRDRHPDYGICPRISRRAGPGREGNNCAVRLSVALWRAGSITLDYFGGPFDHRWNRGRQRRVHRGACGLEAPHVPGAQELANHIRAVWGTGCEVFRPPGRAAAALRGRRGVIFFRNCFARATDDEGERNGDHIDLWDGAEFWNVKLGKSAGGGTAADAPLFGLSDEVWFFPL